MSSQPTNNQATKQPPKPTQGVAILVPVRWPAWALYLTAMCIFLAGVGTGLLWMAAPWATLAVVVIILATVVVLKFR